ncbi:hypothetical protein FNU76_13260 [Chitinimonas arctica]|uniref:Type II secretion system protein GspC N-terminal domain-containing protein n=1 Tax=Chitinimonas arctica TaxID=2594795 RepID=A0A516SGJ6_9NEIS|nr:hypothetical protein [Chitinimonas arctica]QDQ27252.1 hypothetical protein FNU76_13260 [Chitinimonas arctica]
MVGFFRIGLLAALAWLSTGLLTWFNYSPPDRSTIVAPARRMAELDLPDSLDTKPALNTLAKSDIWGSKRVEPVAGGAKSQAEVWSRIAIVKERKGNFVVLASPRGEIKSFHVGDALPDGSQLLKISSAEIVVRRAGEKSSTTHALE